MSELSNSAHEEIQKLAYQRWEERGGPLGSPDDDWFLAEKNHRSSSTSADGVEQQIRTLSAAAGASGSGS